MLYMGKKVYTAEELEIRAKRKEALAKKKAEKEERKKSRTPEQQAAIDKRMENLRLKKIEKRKQLEEEKKNIENKIEVDDKVGQQA